MEAPPDNSGFAKAFLRAASLGDVPMIVRLTAEAERGRGKKVSYANLKTQHGLNALHLAAAFGKTQMCRHLIHNLKFDVDATDDTGLTPLFQAVSGNSRPTVIFLIDNGADVKKRGTKGYTLLHAAAERGYKELMKLLISKGADLSAIAQGVGTPLHSAASNGKCKALQYLLDLKLDPNSLSPINMSPLMLSMLAGSLECIELLLKAGADPNRVSCGTTLLCCCALEPNEKMIRALLKAGADPNMTDISGMSPLEHAAGIGSTMAVELFFPVTSCIPCYPVWSVSGVMQYVHSEEASAQRKIKKEEIFLMAKAKGEEAVATKDYIDAMYWYTQAILADPKDAKVLSDRSLCWSQLGLGHNALLDAQSCVVLEPSLPKAHYSEGVAWKVLKQYAMAAEAFSQALARDPGNKEFEKACRDAWAEHYKSNLHVSGGRI